MTAQLLEGDQAPAFELPQDGDDPVSLTGLKGKKVVLYFYPKDDTPGCTVEAIDFSGLRAEFEEAGAVVLGVSPDSTASHGKFRKKHDLTIALLADESKKMLQDYGVWAEKSMYGRTYMGVERTTFLIDSKGAIARVWRKVKVPGHAQEVLEAARALS